MDWKTAIDTSKQVIDDGHVVEQVRQASLGLDDYIIIVRLKDGTIYQVDDTHPWPISEPETQDATPEGVVVQSEESLDNS